MPLTDIYCPICYKTEFVNVKSLDNFDHRSLHGDRSTIFNYDSDDEQYKLALTRHQNHHAHHNQPHYHRFSMYEQDLTTKGDARIKTWVQQSKQHTFARIKILNNFEIKQPKRSASFNFVKYPIRPPIRQQRMDVVSEDERQKPKVLMMMNTENHQYRSPASYPSATPSSGDGDPLQKSSFLSPVQESSQKSRESQIQRNRPPPLPSQSPGLPLVVAKTDVISDTSKSMNNLERKRDEKQPVLLRASSFIHEKRERTPPLPPPIPEFKVKTPGKKTSSKRREKSPLFFQYDQVLERMKTPIMKKVSENTQKQAPPVTPPPVKVRTEKKTLPPSPEKSKRVVEQPRREVKPPRRKRTPSLSPVSPVLEKREPKPRRRRSPKVVKRTPTPSPELVRRKSKPKKQRTPTPSPEPVKKESKPKRNKSRTPTPSPEPVKRKPKKQRTPTPSPEPEKQPRRQKSPKPRTPTPEPVKRKPKKQRTPTPSPEPEKQPRRQKTPKPRTPTPTPSPEPERRKRRHRRRRTKEKIRSPTPEEEEEEMTIEIPEPKPRKEKTRKQHRARTPPRSTSPDVRLPEIVDKKSAKKERATPGESVLLPEIKQPQSDQEIQMSNSLKTKISKSTRMNNTDKDIQTDSFIKREQSTIATSPIDGLTPISPIRKQSTFNSIALSPIFQRQETSSEITSTPVVKKVYITTSATSPIEKQHSIIFDRSVSPIRELTHRSMKDMQTDAVSNHEQQMQTDDIEKVQQTEQDIQTDFIEKPLQTEQHMQTEPPNERVDMATETNDEEESEANSERSGSTIKKRPNKQPRGRRRQPQRKVIKQIHHHYYQQSPREESVEDIKRNVTDSACSPLPVEKNDDIIISLAKEGDTNIIEVRQKKSKKKTPQHEEPSYVMPHQTALIYDDDARSDTSSSSRPITSHSQKRPSVHPNPNIVQATSTTADEHNDSSDTVVFKLEDLQKETEEQPELETENDLLKRPLSTIREDETDDHELSSTRHIERPKVNPVGARTKIVKLKDLKTDLNLIKEDDDVESSLPSNRSSNKHVTFDNDDYEDRATKIININKKKRSNLLPREKEISSREKALLFVEDNFSNRYITKKFSGEESDDTNTNNDELISNPTIRITSAKSIATSRSESNFSEPQPVSRFNIRVKNRPNVFKKAVSKTQQQQQQQQQKAKEAEEQVEKQKEQQIDDDIQLVQRLLQDTDLLDSIEEQQQPYLVYPSSAPAQIQYNQMYADQQQQQYYYYYHPQSALPAYQQPYQQQSYYIEQQQPQAYYQYVTTPTPDQQILFQQAQVTEKRNAASSPIKEFEPKKKPVKKIQGPMFIISNNSNQPVLVKDHDTTRRSNLKKDINRH